MESALQMEEGCGGRRESERKRSKSQPASSYALLRGLGLLSMPRSKRGFRARIIEMRVCFVHC